MKQAIALFVAVLTSRGTKGPNEVARDLAIGLLAESKRRRRSLPSPRQVQVPAACIGKGLQRKGLWREVGGEATALLPAVAWYCGSVQASLDRPSGATVVVPSMEVFGVGRPLRCEQFARSGGDGRRPSGDDQRHGEREREDDGEGDEQKEVDADAHRVVAGEVQRLRRARQDAGDFREATGARGPARSR